MVELEVCRRWICGSLYGVFHHIDLLKSPEAGLRFCGGIAGVPAQSKAEFVLQCRQQFVFNPEDPDQ